MTTRSLSVEEASEDALQDDDGQHSITTILASIRTRSQAEKAAFGDACGDRENTALPAPFACPTGSVSQAAMAANSRSSNPPRSASRARSSSLNIRGRSSRMHSVPMACPLGSFNGVPA